jgi:YD repeat-containing protein
MNRTAFYYDNRSNLKCVLAPDNGLTYYTYDAGNRMTSVKNPWGEVTQYEYSPGGHLLKRILGNATIACRGCDVSRRAYGIEVVRPDLTLIPTTRSPVA